MSIDCLELKVTEAMHRIESLYNDTKGQCYVSFSGGKDSTVILALIKMCSEIYTLPPEGIKAVFSDTGIELGATREFVNWCRENWYPNIEIIRPEKSFSWVLENKGKPIRSKMKSEFIERFQRTRRKDTLSWEYMLGVGSNGKTYCKTKIADRDLHFIHDDFDIPASKECCTILKKKPFDKYNKDHNIKGYILGERISEGGVRAMAAEKRIAGGVLCTKTKGDYVVKLPLIDWTDEDVNSFIAKYNVPLSKAYTEYGLERTGCFCCPFSLQLKDNLQTLYEHEPSRYKASMYWLKDVYIAQGVELPFDSEYEKERIAKWKNCYYKQRNEMLEKYRPQSRLLKRIKQISMDEL